MLGETGLPCHTTSSSFYSVSAAEIKPAELRRSLPCLPQTRGFLFYPPLAACEQGMKTTPSIDQQSTPSCLNRYIFNEVLLQCSAVTSLLEYMFEYKQLV